MSWVLPSEIFPYRARAKASSVSTACHFAVALVGSGLLKVALKDQYRYRQRVRGQDRTGCVVLSKSLHRQPGCLLTFSLLAALTSLIVYAAVPETKGNCDV